MIQVKLSTLYPHWPLARQTPGQSGRFGDCQFHINCDVESCDYFVVLEDLITRQTTRCPPDNTLLVTFEPPDIRGEYPRYLAQFHTVITCQRDDLRHPNLVFGLQGTPWHAGCQRTTNATPLFRFDYDYWKALPPPPKQGLASVLCSNKAFTPGHRRRIALVEHLKRRLGDRLDVFGAGRRDISDKWDAIAGYRYHIAIENSAVPYYWTEKLSDAYLGWSLPFYYGCPNIGDFFPAGSYRPIDPSDPEGAANAIADAIDSGLYEGSIDEIGRARQLVLDRYNVFALLAEFCTKHVTPGAIKQRVSISRSRSFMPIWRRAYERVISR